MPESWGSIVAGTRLEKMVDSQFVMEWSHFITTGLRPGDGFLMARDRTAHKAANELFRRFLFTTEQDSLLLIDSDASFKPPILEDIRKLKDGWEYDIFQAFYTRRGWPPEAIWFKENALGESMQAYILGEGTEDTTMVGFHFTLIRRRVLEKIWRDQGEGKIDPDEFDWAWYPRHSSYVEDAAFCIDAKKYGFRIGSTSHIKTGHITRITTGWETYQQFLEISGQRARIDRFNESLELVSEFIDEDKELVRAKSLRGSANVRDGLEAYLFTLENGSESIGDLNANQAREFYGRSDSGYFYDLLAWNSTPFYDLTLEPLREVSGQSILVVGGGIGGEVEILKGRNGVVVFELPGTLRDFLEFRYKDDDSVQIYTEPEDLREIAAPPEEYKYDLIIAIDTIEHIHPDSLDGTLDKMLDLLKAKGSFYFRNNFEQADLYPMHYDNRDKYYAWIHKNDLELLARFDKTEAELFTRKGEESDAS